MLGWLDGPLSVSKNTQGCPCSFKVQQAPFFFFFFFFVGVPFFVPLVFNEFQFGRLVCCHLAKKCFCSTSEQRLGCLRQPFLWPRIGFLMHVLLQRKQKTPQKKKQGHYLRNKYLLGPLSFGCCSDHTHSLIRAVSLHYVFSTSCAQSHLIAVCPSVIEGALCQSNL